MNKIAYCKNTAVSFPLVSSRRFKSEGDTTEFL